MDGVYGAPRWERLRLTCNRCPRSSRPAVEAEAAGAVELTRAPVFGTLVLSSREVFTDPAWGRPRGRAAESVYTCPLQRSDRLPDAPRPVIISHLALQPSTRLGPYEVTAQIGEGGMGEVYQATDTKLKRQVAIKTLPEAFASDT